MKTLLVTSTDPKLSDSSVSSFIVEQNELPVFVSSNDSSLLDPVEDIRVRAETVTSLLKEIIEYRPPMHWGINE